MREWQRMIGCEGHSHDIGTRGDRCACGLYTREHLVLVDLMNALDVYMPPAGSELLEAARRLASKVGYPWDKGVADIRSAPPLSSDQGA